MAIFDRPWARPLAGDRDVLRRCGVLHARRSDDEPRGHARRRSLASGTARPRSREADVHRAPPLRRHLDALLRPARSHLGRDHRLHLHRQLRPCWRPPPRARHRQFFRLPHAPSPPRPSSRGARGGGWPRRGDCGAEEHPCHPRSPCRCARCGAAPPSRRRPGADGLRDGGGDSGRCPHPATRRAR